MAASGGHWNKGTFKAAGGTNIDKAATTATLRKQAREFADQGDYKKAQKFMREAIKRYPAGAGQLREHDIAKMQSMIDSWNGF